MKQTIATLSLILAVASTYSAQAEPTNQLASLITPSATSAVPENIGIIAVVNDEVISSLDLKDRIDLIIGTTGRPDTPQVRRALRKQVTQLLVDEALKLQEAARYSITISDDDISGAVSRIEAASGKPKGALEGFIESKGLSIDSFHRQIKSEVAWSKLLARKVRSEVKLDDEEIYRAQQRMAAGKKIKELQIASIIVPMMKGLSEEDVIGIARDIRSQLKNGADAGVLIKAYADRMPLDFGPMTWVARDQINPDIAQALENVKVGDISEPVRTPSGYQILRLLDERTRTSRPEANAEVALKQIILKLNEGSSESEIGAMMQIARSVAKYPGTCMEEGLAGMQDIEGLDIGVNYIRTTFTNMASDVRTMVEPLHVTEITEPFAAPDGIHMLMLCERIDLPTPLPDREEVRQVVFEEKLQLEAEKFLRTLRREAFVDVRV